MSINYLDITAYTYSATPTWGVPQDGDGTAAAAAASSATLSVDLTSAVFNSTNSTVSIMGAASLTITTGANSATNIQYSTTLATMIDNIVTVVNTLASAVIVNKPTGWSAPKTMDAVFARRTGNTLELMTRSGSASWNTLIGILFNNVTNITNATWSGGSGGCWGWLFNPSVLFPSSIAVGAYGVLPGMHLAGKILVAGDILWLRATDTKIEAIGGNVTAAAAFDAIVDASNTNWPNTLGKVFEIKLLAAGGNLIFGLFNTRTSFIAPVKYSMVFSNYSIGPNNNSIISFNTTLGGTNFFSGVFFYDASTAGKIVLFNPTQLAASRNYIAHQCKFQYVRGSTPYQINYFLPGVPYTSSVSYVIDDCDFIYDSLSSPHPGVIACHTAASYRVTNCRAFSAATTPPFYMTGQPGSSSILATAENLTGFSITTAALGFSGLNATAFGSAEQCVALMQNIGPKKAYRYESNTQLIDWLPDTGFPTLTATMPDGTPWSYRAFWLGGVLAHSPGAISSSVSLTKRAPLSDAIRTIEMELLLDTAVGALTTNSKLALDVTYTDNSGAGRTETTRQAGWIINAGTAIPSSNAAWIKNGYSASHSAFKLKITTTYQVKAGCDVVGKLVMLAPSPISGSAIFVEPELTIT